MLKRNQCCLLSFIEKLGEWGNYVLFWTISETAHCAMNVLNYLNWKKMNFRAKKDIVTHVPQS